MMEKSQITKSKEKKGRKEGKKEKESTCQFGLYEVQKFKVG